MGNVLGFVSVFISPICFDTPPHETKNILNVARSEFAPHSNKHESKQITPPKKHNSDNSHNPTNYTMPLLLITKTDDYYPTLNIAISRMPSGLKVHFSDAGKTK